MKKRIALSALVAAVLLLTSVELMAQQVTPMWVYTTGATTGDVYVSAYGDYIAFTDQSVTFYLLDK